jgi:hypothetical protein
MKPYAERTTITTTVEHVYERFEDLPTDAQAHEIELERQGRNRQVEAGDDWFVGEVWDSFHALRNAIGYGYNGYPADYSLVGEYEEAIGGGTPAADAAAELIIRAARYPANDRQGTLDSGLTGSWSDKTIIEAFLSALDVSPSLSRALHAAEQAARRLADDEIEYQLSDECIREYLADCAEGPFVVHVSTTKEVS